MHSITLKDRKMNQPNPRRPLDRGAARAEALLTPIALIGFLMAAGAVTSALFY